MELVVFKKNILLYILSTSIIGCASNPQESAAPTRVTNIPSLSLNGRNIAQENGYSNGKWATDCRSKSGITQEISSNEIHIIIKTYDNGNITETSKIYEAAAVAKGVINIKMLSSNNRGEYISSQKSGFVSGRRMIFDSSSIMISGVNKSAEVVTAKDGYQISRGSDGALIKGKPMSTFERCD